MADCEICGARLTQEDIRLYEDLCEECVMSETPVEGGPWTDVDEFIRAVDAED